MKLIFAPQLPNPTFLAATCTCCDLEVVALVLDINSEGAGAKGEAWEGGDGRLEEGRHAKGPAHVGELILDLTEELHGVRVMEVYSLPE
jgi:hypothetical protein